MTRQMHWTCRKCGVVWEEPLRGQTEFREDCHEVSLCIGCLGRMRVEWVAGVLKVVFRKRRAR